MMKYLKKIFYVLIIIMLIASIVVPIVGATDDELELKEIDKQEQIISSDQKNEQSLLKSQEQNVSIEQENVQIIEDGVYKINSRIGAYIDIANGLKDNGANVQIWEKSKSDRQDFKITYLKDGYYKIEAVHSKKVLDVYAGNKANGTNVWQYEYNGSDAQKWKIKDLGNGYYNLISKCNGLCLDIYGGLTKNGTNVQVYESNGTSAQQFAFEKVEQLKGEKTLNDGIYKINAGVNSNSYVEIADDSKNNGANVQIWEKNKSDGQKFKVTYLDNGYYKIESVNSKKVLDVYAGNKANGTNVWQYEYNGSDAQKWIIKDAGNGYYNLISKCNELYLDVYAGLSKNGTNIDVYEGNGTKAQKFKFEEVVALKGKKTLDDGVYKIKLSTTNDMLVSVANRGKENGANIQINKDSDFRSQKFKLTYLNDGFYKIEVANTNKVLDVYAGNKTNGTNVWQYEYNGSDAQKWVIKDLGNGYYSIISKCSELYLDVYGGYSSDGTNIQIYEKNETPAQQFIFEKTELHALDSGLYEIQMAKNSNKVLDIEDGSTSDFANLQIWDRSNVNHQKFYFEYDGKNNNYTIKAIHSGKALDVYAGLSDNGTNVQQYTENNTRAQKWKIADLGKGNYNIISECGGLYLDIFGGYTYDGTNVQIYQSNDSIAQQFKIVETSLSNNSNYNSLDESKYPGYKTLLNNLQMAHPNWSFRIYYTGVDWNTMVEKENGGSSTSPNSLIWDSFGNEWINGTAKYDVSKRWYKASKKAIAYIMDPRNSMKNETSMFQFQELASSSGTKLEISKMTEGTFLHTNSITDAIYEAANTQGISPFHIVSRIKQEHGSKGGTLNGYTYNGRKVYNLFNIKVSGSNAIEDGAKYAYEQGWFSAEACIKGGAQFLKTNYINRGQSTLYFQRFDVMSNPICSHQYMQNLTAASTEGNQMYTSYRNAGLLDSHFTFTIPVYENMPVSLCPMPIG